LEGEAVDVGLGLLSRGGDVGEEAALIPSALALSRILPPGCGLVHIRILQEGGSGAIHEIHLGLGRIIGDIEDFVAFVALLRLSHQWWRTAMRSVDLEGRRLAQRPKAAITSGILYIFYVYFLITEL